MRGDGKVMGRGWDSATEILADLNLEKKYSIKQTHGVHKTYKSILHAVRII